jgi:octaprenyl-diphosphate synthase
LRPNEIYRLVENGLACVEVELAQYSRSNIHIVDCVSQYVHTGGGKRIRPTLLLLAAQLCGCEGPAAHRLGAVVELIHSATLVHDDILDDAKVRRGRPSVNARWGNPITVLMGDWLYMTSFNIALGERRFKILDILIDVTRKMVEGELIQLSMNGKIDVTEEQHLDIAMRKTAYLFSACAEIGGILGDVSEEKQQCLRHYGLNVGIAFQLVDDLLDITSNESTLGKPVCTDLSGGKLTLPLIYLMRSGDPAHRSLVQELMGGEDSAAPQKKAIMDLLSDLGILERVRHKSRDYALQAREALSAFPCNPAREALLAIPNFIVDRDR